MSSVRDRTVVVDFSVLPDRPKLDIVQRFVNKCLGLSSKDIQSIQLNNIRHCVLIAMADAAAASNIATAHHLKHAFRINPDKKLAIPVYVDDDTIDVRIHDLPTDVPNLEIAEAMREYGKVLSIRDEVWRDFFPGVPNGVRVLKMKLSKPVPSYITVRKYRTLATHTSQIATCRHCGLKRHASRSCSEAAKPQPKPKNPNNDPSATVLPTANSAVVEPQVIVPHTEVIDDEGFTIVGKKGKTKRQLSNDDDDDNRSTGNDHCNDQGQPEEQKQQKTPKRRLCKSTEM